MRLLRLLTNNRFWPLFMKELRQIKRNRKLVVMLIMPPTVNLVLLGFAMNSEVKNIKLGVVDYSRTTESRELVSAFVESGSFQIAETLRLDRRTRAGFERGQVGRGRRRAARLRAGARAGPDGRGADFGRRR